MKEYLPMVGTTAAPSYAYWHDDPACHVEVFCGPVQLFVNCKTCKIAVNLEAIAFRADPVTSYMPRKDLPDDTSDTGSSSE